VYVVQSEKPCWIRKSMQNTGKCKFYICSPCCSHEYDCYNAKVQPVNMCTTCLPWKTKIFFGQKSYAIQTKQNKVCLLLVQIKEHEAIYVNAII
jgi:hypothetical protein